MKKNYIIFFLVLTVILVSINSLAFAEGLLASDYLKQGITYNNSGRYEDALNSFSKAIELYPNYADAYCNEAISYLNLNKYEDAVNASVKAILINPNYVEAYLHKGEALNKLERFDEALTALNKAIELNKNVIGVYINKCIALKGLERFQEALDAINSGLNLDLQNAQAYFYKGAVLLKIGSNGEALVAIDKAIELDSKNAEAYFYKGIIMNIFHHYEDAITAYDNATRIKPDYEDAYKNKADILLILERYKDALEAYTKVTDLSPTKNAYIYTIKADIYKKLGMSLEEANSRIIAKDPSQIRIVVDGKVLNLDAQAQNINGRVFVPLRAIFDALGATIEWDAKTSIVNATKGNSKISLSVGDSIAKVDNTRVELSAAPRILNGRVMVPARFIGESLGATVTWSSNDITVNIVSKK